MGLGLREDSFMWCYISIIGRLTVSANGPGRPGSPLTCPPPPMLATGLGAWTYGPAYDFFYVGLGLLEDGFEVVMYISLG